MIDFHVHLAGTGCCGSGIFLSQTFRRRPTFLVLRYLEGVTSEQMETNIDGLWAKRIYNLVETSHSIEKCVALCLDEVYSESGVAESEKTHMYVPNNWGKLVAQKSNQRVLWGASIHPYRNDAIEQLQQCVSESATLIKWLPSAQGIDPRHSKSIAFFRQMAKLKIPLLSHTDKEFTFPCHHKDWMRFNDVERLRPALEEGVTVIAAHAATPHQMPELIELMKKHPNLYADSSGLFNPSRAHVVNELVKRVKDSLLSERILFGSDWPVPTIPSLLVASLGVQEYARIRRIQNPFDKDAELKEVLGIPRDIFVRNQKSMLTSLNR